MPSLSLQAQAAAQATGIQPAHQGRSKSIQSYLYAPTAASRLSLSDVRSDAHNALLGMIASHPALEKFDTPLFGDAKDRMLLGKDENDKLDRSLNACLATLSPLLQSRQSARIIEWLVRRHQIQRFNVQALFWCFLPYFDTPSFATMLQLVQLDQTSFAPFQAIQQSKQALTQHTLVQILIKHLPILQIYLNQLRFFADNGSLTPEILATFQAVISNYLSQVKEVDQSRISTLLPPLIDGLKSSNNAEWNLASAMLLVQLFAKIRPSKELTDATLEVFTGAIQKAKKKDEKLAHRLGIAALAIAMKVEAESAFQ